MAVASSVGVWLYDTRDLTLEPQYLEAGTTETLVVAYSADGRRLAAGSDFIRVWDTDTYELINTIDTGGRAGSLAFSPDGTQLVASNLFGSEREGVITWDVETGDQVAVFSEHLYVDNLAFSPDGALIAGIQLCDCTLSLMVWDAASGELLSSNEPAAYFAFSPDSQTIAISHQANGISLWDVHTNNLTNLVDGDNIYGSEDLYTIATAYTFDSEQVLLLHDQGKLQIWDLETAKLAGELTLSIQPYRLSLSPDGNQFTVINRSGDVGIWELATGQLITQTEEQPLIDGAIRFSQDGNLFAAGVWNEVWVWDITTGERILKLSSGEVRITDMAFSPDGQLLAASSKFVHVWHIPGGDLAYTITPDEQPIKWVVFTPGERLITASEDTIQAWAAETGDKVDLQAGNESEPTIHSFTFGDYDGITSFSYSPTGAMAVANYAGIHVWRWEDPDNPWLHIGGDRYHRPVNDIEFLHHTLVTGGANQVVEQWDARTGGHLAVLTPHDSEIYSVAVNTTYEESEIIASAGCAQQRYSPWDGSPYCDGADLRLWSFYGNLQVVVPQGHTDVINHLVFRPDTLLASASKDGTVIFWGIPVQTPTP